MSVLSQAKVEKVQYGPWSSCFKVSNDKLEFTAVPAISRLLSLKLKGGPEMFWNPELSGGKKTFEPWEVLGGFYNWIAPQNGWVNDKGALSNWPPDPDLERKPCTVKVLDENTIILTTPLSKVYGLRFEKTYQLDPAAAKVKVDMKLTNEGSKPVRWSIWNLGGVPCRGKVIVPGLKVKDIFFWDNPEKGKAAFLHLAKNTKAGLELTLDGFQKEGAKMWYPAGPLSVIHVLDGVTWTRTFENPPKAFFTDMGAQIEIFAWGEKGYAEIEILGPEETIPAKGSIVWKETWELKR